MMESQFPGQQSIATNLFFLEDL